MESHSNHLNLPRGEAHKRETHFRLYYIINTNTNIVITTEPFTPEVTNGALQLESLTSTPCLKISFQLCKSSAGFFNLGRTIVGFSASGKTPFAHQRNRVGQEWQSSLHQPWRWIKWAKLGRWVGDDLCYLCGRHMLHFRENTAWSDIEAGGEAPTWLPV